MNSLFDKGSACGIVCHPDTGDEYEIDCYWSYSYCPATLEDPAESEFKTFSHSLVSINNKPTKQPIPDWVNWDNYEEYIFNKIM